MAKKGAAVDGDPEMKAAAELKRELKRMVASIFGEERDEFVLDAIDRAKEALFALRDLKASKTASLRISDVSLSCPEEFGCPLSKQLMRDPVVVTTGQVDPTGAGDCFLAGFVATLVQGLAVPDAALLGNLFGSLTVERVGLPVFDPSLLQVFFL